MASIWANKKLRAALAGMLFLLAAALLFRQVSCGGPIKDHIDFVCVATGKTYSLARSKVARIPERNPDTGEETLMPYVRENGVLKVSARYRAALDRLSEKNRYVDPQTLAVRTAP
jgi:hypothetical protein